MKLIRKPSYKIEDSKVPSLVTGAKGFEMVMGLSRLTDLVTKKGLTTLAITLHGVAIMLNK